MTTPILPTKAQLAAYTYSPATLAADAEVENFLTVTNNYSFILQLIQGFRGGIGQTYEINRVSFTCAATEIVYIGTDSDVTSLIKYLTGTLYGYIYTVTIPQFSAGDNPIITAWVPTTTTGYYIPNGANHNKTCIKVAWA
jgi:hypothetical protein